jgi:predicted transposase YdaD
VWWPKEKATFQPPATGYGPGKEEGREGGREGGREEGRETVVIGNADSPDSCHISPGLRRREEGR